MLYEIGDKVLDEWVITRTIGEGSYGKVVEIERNEFGLSMKSALKIISIPGNNSELKAVMGEGVDNKSITSYFYGFVEEIIKEIAIMSELKGHTNIVTYEDHRVIPHEDHIGWDILIRMELLTSLLDYSEEHEITEQTVIKLGTDILTALEVCQKYHVVHRDIKPENIFVSATGDFKLGDFGIARTIEKTTFGMSKKGTYPYMAPEIYQGKESDILVDMYSLGLVMYRMLNDNRLPFFPEYPKKVTYVDRENALYRRIQGETFPKPRHGSKELGNIVMKSCQYQKEDRYGSIFQMKEALEHLNGNTSKNLNRIYGMTDAKKRQVRQREEGTVKDYKFSSEKSVGKKIKVGTNWAGVVFSGILNAIDNYEEFGTTKSKRFWEETLLETAFEVMEDITVRAVVSVALTAICGGATVVAISAVTVGVIWAIDVANGYITEKSGGESKRAAEAVSDFILDIGKTKKGEE